eukprot:gene21020-33723_t
MATLVHTGRHVLGHLGNKWNVWLRPHAAELLRFCADRCELAFWTLIQLLMKIEKHCHKKNLQRLGRDKSTVLIVEA